MKPLSSNRSKDWFGRLEVFTVATAKESQCPGLGRAGTARDRYIQHGNSEPLSGRMKPTGRLWRDCTEFDQPPVSAARSENFANPEVDVFDGVVIWKT